MKTAFFTALLAVVGVVATPVRRQGPQIDDAAVLNFALTLEHLENAFYTGGLAQFDANAFAQAGFPSWVRPRFEEIAKHETSHVKFLSTALADKATQPCTYNFPYTDVKSFTALSQMLEGVGVSAYTGAAQLITNKDYLTAAASVLATEARHASWIAAAVNKQAGWSGDFDTPLGLNQIFTIAGALITSCPSTNPTLPVKAFPSATIPSAAPGTAASVSFNSSDARASGQLYVAFFFGLSQTIVPITDGKVIIPEGLSGQAYAAVTTDANKATDDTILAGPAVLQFPRDSAGNLIPQ